MLSLSRIQIENSTSCPMTDEPRPTIAFALSSDRAGAALKSAKVRMNGWETTVTSQVGIRYDGPALLPFNTYTVEIEAEDTLGDTARGNASFTTGRMEIPWAGQWITDGSFTFTEKKVSPVPMYFRKKLSLQGSVQRAELYMTALGTYRAHVDGREFTGRYFAPGFTDYRHTLQYQRYDLTDSITDGSVLTVTVAGGWAVGSFVMSRGNRCYADRQALLAELRITYEDGTKETIGTDSSWQVTTKGPMSLACIYDGETVNAGLDLTDLHPASPERPKVHPRILADRGEPVTEHEVFAPVKEQILSDGAAVFDFGQNMAGIVRMTLRGKKGQTVTVHHAEILNADGSPNLSFLRSAKSTLTYTCKEGEQTYAPQFTYMGFRYASVSGIDRADILKIEAVSLRSDMEEIGAFTCSDPLLSRLQKNIEWGAKSNLFDIPTDCPQRDERMGWTGDIAVFAPTACFNFDMGRFFDKWFRDVKTEQGKGGGLPNTIPSHSYGFPETMPLIATDFWGDVCILAPWARYEASGDVRVLEEMYPVMKKYVDACRFWAGLLSFGKRRYIWHTVDMLHFGDWVAPDVPKMQQWQGRHKWTATASLCNTSHMLSKVAGILGKTEDAAFYENISKKAADAYVSVFTDGDGKLKNEFQTAYALPLYFNMFPPEQQAKAAENLAALVRKNGYRIGTGFPGTPYILFALADNGKAEDAFRMLMCKDAPSWLYEVRVGATTIWERWDGLDENGLCPIQNSGTADVMISYNHYASGAVGAFLYRRVLGLEPTEPGYKTFAVKPLPGGGLTSAAGSTVTPYGKIDVSWSLEGQAFTLNVTVPVSTTAHVTMPDGTSKVLTSGTHTVRSAAM